MAAEQNLLTPRHLDRLNADAVKADALLEQIKQCNDCGMNVQEYMERCQACKDAAIAMRQTFFPEYVSA